MTRPFPRMVRTDMIEKTVTIIIQPAKEKGGGVQPVIVRFSLGIDAIDVSFSIVLKELWFKMVIRWTFP